MKPDKFVVPDRHEEQHAERMGMMMADGIGEDVARAAADDEIRALMAKVVSDAKAKEKEKFMKTLREMDAKYAGRRAQWDKS